MKISIKKVKKLINLAMAVSEEKPKTKDELYDQIIHYDKEIAKITKGMNEEDRIKVYKTGWKQVRQFESEPHLKILFRDNNKITK
jgi:hypothetical protein